MTNEERIEVMRERLEAALNPSELDIIDESHLHIGHAGAKSGAGHFAVCIKAQALQNVSKVKAHQLIYQAVGDLLGEHIHALRIQILNLKKSS